MKSEEKAGSGFAPGLGVLMSKLLASRGSGKKRSGSTPLEPKKAPAHHLNRWRDEGRAELVLAGIRLGVLETGRPPVGRGGQYSTWKQLAMNVEYARRIKNQDVGM